jgi:hypothetical protein
MIPTGFQPTIPVSERPHIHALQRLNEGIVQNRIQKAKLLFAATYYFLGNGYTNTALKLQPFRKPYT